MNPQLPKTAIFFCNEVLPALKLPAHEHVSNVFFRWQCAEPSVDAGVPTAVADVLARALCEHFHATFIAPAVLVSPDAPLQWTAYDRYQAQNQRRLLRPKMPLIWSRDPAIVAQAFDEYWCTEGQFILLSTRPVPLDFNAFELQGDAVLILRYVAADNAAVGALLPGVDGDFAGLYLADAQAMQRFLEVDLAEECARAGISLQLQSAADFAPGARLAT